MLSDQLERIASRLVLCGLAVLLFGVVAGYATGAYLLPAHNTYIVELPGEVRSCLRNDGIESDVDCGRWKRVYDLSVFEPNRRGGATYVNPMAAFMVGVPIGSAGMVLLAIGMIVRSTNPRRRASPSFRQEDLPTG